MMEPDASPPLPTPEAGHQSAHLLEVALVFLRLGATAFGGPAAHVALMRSEFVARRKWISEQGFLDLLGATNLIPGPNSTEMAIHLGYLRAGIPGLIAGGVGFILPAMLFVLALAWMYVRFGSTPELSALLYGMKPVIVIIVLDALWNLGKRAVKGWLTGAAGVAALVLYLVGINEIALLFAIGLLVMLIANIRRTMPRNRSGLPFMIPLMLPAAIQGAAPFSLPILFFTFLKIGSVLYGSGYVLLAFLRADLVNRLGWITEGQLIDAVAVGQLTPGPLFTTATFLGYLIGGVPGALLATIGIFLPAFIFVAITNPLIPRLRQSPWAGALLDGVNVASVGLMAGVTLQLGRASIIDPLTIALAVVSTVLLLKYRVSATWLMIGGGLVGLLALFI